MSNFPPPPPFGGGFFQSQPPFTQQPPIPPPNPYGVNPQFQYMQQRHQPYGQGPPSHQSNQFNNPANFSQNQYHMPTPPFQPPQQVPPNFYHFPYHGSTLPPSSGPVMPFPQGASHIGGFNPMHSNNIHIPATGPSQANTPLLHPSAPPQEQFQRPPQIIPLPNNTTGPLDVNGYRGDAEVASVRATYSTLGPTEPASAATAALQNSSSIGSLDGASNFRNEENRMDTDSVQPIDKGIIPLQQAKQPGSTYTLPGLGFNDPESQPTASMARPSAGVETRTPDAAIWYERKAEAKDALLELLTCGISYEQIAKEGVELDILRALAPTSFVPRPARLTAPAVSKEPSVEVRQNSASLEPGEISDSINHDAEPTSTVHPPTQLKAVDENLAVSSPPVAAPDNRKDYIARLQAAKQAVVKAPVAVASSKSTTTIPPNSDISSTGNLSIQNIEPNQPKVTKKADAKDPVQTELVRKRLAALKSAQSRTTKSDMQVNASTPATQVASRFPEELSTVQLGHSFYADNEQGVLDGLPGLSPVTRSKVMLSNADASLARSLPFSSQVASYPPVEMSGTPDLVQNVPANTDRLTLSTGPTPRKRPSASDFIDSPPTRKRHLGEEEAIQLVIDVSDEEDGEFRSDTARSQSLEPASTPERHSKREQSSLRDKPPLSNFPFGSSTPRPTSQAQTPKSLSQLETELAAAKERLAAAERSKKMGRPESSQGLSSQRLDSGDMTPNKLLESENQLEKSQNVKQQQQRLLAANRQRLHEKLEAERRTHALITARAEQEQRQAAEATSLTERERRLQRKAALESSLPKLDAGIETARKRLDEIHRQQVQLQSEIDREMKDRQAILDEITALMNIDLESETSTSRSERTREPTNESNEKSVDEGAIEPADRIVHQSSQQPVGVPAGEAGNNASADSATKSEIVSLNASITHEKKTSVSPQSSADLPDVRQPSAETSSRADDALEDEMDISRSSEEERESQEGIEEPDDSIYGDHVDQVVAPAVSGGTTKTNASEEGTNTTPDAYDPSVQEHFSDDDERMDDDSPGMRETEIYPESSHHDESDEYEPTPVSVTPALERNDHPEQVPVFVQYEGDGTLGEKGNVSEEQSASEIVESQPEEGEISDENVSESEDYEPPEPTQAVDNNGTAAIIPKSASLIEAVPPILQDQSREQWLGDSSVNEMTKENSSHYTPYESPLNRFHSYRFHPQYVDNVSGGFSSLTFSHNIQTDRTLCRWELAGGICNDSACQFQHFRDLPLTGNKILLELGSIHEGNTPEDQKRYVDGLRDLLASMRDRGQSDVEAVAADIVAYRSRFLNDPSRVVTHI